MEIYEILNNYYGIENKDMKYYYHMIINLIDYFNLENYINNIEILNSLETCLSLYDYNSKTLVFGNNIFNTEAYDVNSSKAMVYILHELIHVLRAKYISKYKIALLRPITSPIGGVPASNLVSSVCNSYLPSL